MQAIEYYDAELKMSSWLVNGEWYWDEPSIGLVGLSMENGVVYWEGEGGVHRGGGPAIEWADGHKEWWVHDLRHRIDGPAVEYPDGGKEWFLNNVEYTEAEFLIECKK